MGENADRMRRILDAFAAGNPDDLGVLVAPNYVDHQDGGIGREAFVETLQAVRRVYPGIRVTIEDLLEQGNTVAVRVNWDGTKSDGTPIHARSIDVVEFRDGLAVHH